MHIGQLQPDIPSVSPETAALVPLGDIWEVSVPSGVNEVYRLYLEAPSERRLEAVVYACKGLITHFAQRFGCGFSGDDLYQTGVVGLMKAVHSFDAARDVTFSTWASVQIMGEMRHYARAELRHRGVEHIEDETLETWTAASGLTEMDDKVDLYTALAQLDVLEQQVVRALFFQGLSQEQTAKEFGLHQRKVSRVKQKALLLLRELLRQPNFKLTKKAKSFHRL